MTGTLLRIGWLNLKRDYVALGLTFVLPIVFFSIFAAIFGGMDESAGGSGDEGVRVVVVDLDQSKVSRDVVAALREESALSVVPGEIDAEAARAMVRKGEVPVAAILPKGFGKDGISLTGRAGLSVEILYDESDPIARQVVAGMLQKAAVSVVMPRVSIGSGAGGGDGFGGPVPVRMTNVREEEKDGNGGPSMVAYYAAGIGVMFLLFSMAGAAGTLLEEEENGTLERVLTSRIGMGTLLIGRWLFFGIVGLLQVAVMFLWGAYAFGLDLFTANHLVGFAAMATLTAAAAAAFGILLATICRSRSQLGGISTIVILIMSALGGSMVPRFVMPDFMNTTALFTFNGWALDGFLKVFWYDDPAAGVGATLGSIVPELVALAAMTAAFLWLARVFARRWETV
jgi:ABC-2 type transport system permease protein